jgi:hypothetical protein
VLLIWLNLVRCALDGLGALRRADLREKRKRDAGSFAPITDVRAVTNDQRAVGKTEGSGLALGGQLGGQVAVATAAEPWLAMTNGEVVAFNFPMRSTA